MSNPDNIATIRSIIIRPGRQFHYTQGAIGIVLRIGKELLTLDTKTLYEISPREFEQLCMAIMMVTGFDSARLVGGPGDQGVDILGTKDEHRVAVEVKHTRRLSYAKLQDIVRLLNNNPYSASKFFVMTSAPIDSTHTRILSDLSSQGISVQIFAQDDILDVLSEHPEIEQKMLSPTQKRSRRQKFQLWIGLAGAITSLFVGFTTSFLLSQQTNAPLHQRIETVESAIGSLKNLEKDLKDIKNEMVDTQRAIQAINEEYAKAKVLKDITDGQYAATRAALQDSLIWRIVIGICGFGTGIAASVAGNVIYSRWQQRRALV